MKRGTAVLAWSWLLVWYAAQAPTGSNAAALLPRRSSARHLLQDKSAAGSKHWSVQPYRHIQGQDITCTPGSTYCMACNMTVAAVARQCEAQEGCVAFVVDEATGCAYLKSAAGNTISGGSFVTYCDPSRSGDCAGEYNYYPGTDLPGRGDFSCGGPEEGACFQEGSISAVADRCRGVEGCEAFVATWNNPTAQHHRGAGGFLKKATGPKEAKQDVDLYVMAQKDTDATKPADNSNQPQNLPPGSSDMVGPPSPPSSPPPTTQPPGTASGKKLSVGAIAGIAAAAGAGVVALIGLCIFCVLRSKRRKKQAAGEKADGKAPGAANTALDGQFGVQQYDGPTTARIGSH